MAVGSKGTIVTSTNGVDWAAINTHAPFDLNGVDAANVYLGPPVFANQDLFVAVGDAGTILTSPDGLAWTARFSGVFPRLTAVACLALPCTIVAVGESGTAATSSDGVVWTVRTTGTSSNLLAVATDTIGRFGAVGEGGIFMTGFKGLSWTPGQTTTSNNLEGILHLNGNFLAVGEEGTIQAGITWLARNSGTTKDLSAVCFGNGAFVAVGSQGAIVTSRTGSDWVAHDTGSRDLAAVCYGGNKFLAVGTGTILSSSDSSSWTSKSIGSTNLVSVGYGNGVYVAFGLWYDNRGGHPIALRSTDGDNWVPSSSPDFFLPSAIVYQLNLFVAVGGQGSIATSSDGLSWTGRSSGVGDTFSGVAFGKGSFVAVGNQITTSPDGTNWTVGTGGFGSANSLAYGDMGFVVPAVSSGPLINSIATSPDVITWTSHGLEGQLNDHQPRHVAFGNGSYVAVGDHGTIRQTTPLDAPPQPLLSGFYKGEGFELSAITQPGYSYTVQYSPSLVNPDWTDVFTFTNAQPLTSFLDSTTTNRLASFYRITSP